jgi:hypothetical protein
MHKLIPVSIFSAVLFYFIGILTANPLYAQSKTNLDVFYSLSDSAVYSSIDNLHISPGKLNVRIISGDTFSVLQNHMLMTLESKKIDVVRDASPGAAELCYTVENAACSYSDIFRNGFLGQYNVKRELSLKGNYSFFSSPGAGSSHNFKFNYNYIDTVKLDDIKDLENISYRFTTGTIPAEPFFTGLFEPIFALGTAALAVTLFFTVRSK